MAGLKPLELVERAALIEILNEYGWTKSHVARQLELTRTTLWRKLKKYELSVDTALDCKKEKKAAMAKAKHNHFIATGFRVVHMTSGNENDYAILMLDNFEIGDNVGGWPQGLPRKLVKWAKGQAERERQDYYNLKKKLTSDIEKL